MVIWGDNEGLARDEVDVGIVGEDVVLEIGVGGWFVLMVLFGVEYDKGEGGRVEAEGMGGGVMFIYGVLRVGICCIDWWVVEVGNMW